MVKLCGFRLGDSLKSIEILDLIEFKTRFAQGKLTTRSMNLHFI